MIAPVTDTAKMTKAIVIFGGVEFAMLMAGLAFYLATGIFWGIVAAAVAGFVLFGVLIGPMMLAGARAGQHQTGQNQTSQNPQQPPKSGASSWPDDGNR